MKKYLFITTKNLDYIRNVQEINILKERGKVDVIGCNHRNYVMRILEVYIRILFIHIDDYEEIFIGFAPQLVLPLFKWKFRKKIITIDFFISVWDTMIFDRKKFGEKSVFAKIFKWIDKECINCADNIVSDTIAHGEFFVKELGACKDKLRTIYLEADRSIYYPRKIQRDKKLGNRFIVLYFGSILPLQGIEVVLDALSILKDDNRFYFYIIGPIKNEEQKVFSENIEYIDWLEQDKLAQKIAISDLCLAGHFHPTIEKAKRTIPGKAYIYESMGKAMILGDNPANHELFQEDLRHKFVPMGNGHALANSIRNCIDKEM